MGNNCMATTPNEIYSEHLKGVNVGQLKDLWQTAKVYKIKQIYQSYAKQFPDDLSKTHIPYEAFIQIFPQLDKYEEIHKRRLFQIFDYENQGFLDWNNFFTTISICYFAAEQIMTVIMFMIFDEALSLELTRNQVYLLAQLNDFCLKNQRQTDSEIELNRIADQIIQFKQTLTIQRWKQVAGNYFDLSKYRRLFNVFKEQRIQKQLIMNFNEWNDLYDEESQKLISYVVSYKWFQGWKIYVQDHYGVNISINTIRQLTLKSLKTKKTMHKKEIKTMKKIASSKSLKLIEFCGVQQQNTSSIQINNQLIEGSPKNIDFIHCNIGQRSKEIYNSVLQGQFEQVLKPQIVQNRDYVLVSQRVWSALKQVYGGGPQFRRTGFDSIQLYPKIIKIYSALFNNQIDYSSQVIRQVSSYLTITELMTRSIDIDADDLKRKKIYYKTIGMVRWEPIDELDFMFSEITSDVMIFLIYLDQADDEVFKKSHSKMPKHITEVNVGDYIKFTDPQTKVEKQAVFMGKNTEGKYIIHFPKQSYSLDKCLVESDAIKSCKITSSQYLCESVKLKNKTEIQWKGISNAKSLGFISSTILNLFNNKHFKSLISMYSSFEQQPKMMDFLSNIYHSLQQKKTVDTRDILDMIELFLPQYQNFQVSQSEEFLKDFYGHLMFELGEMDMNKKIEESVKLKLKSNKKCLKCQTQLKDQIQDYCLSIQIPEEKQAIYEIVFVPICSGIRSIQIKKYGLSLPPGSTLKKLKQQFEQVAQLPKNRPYVLAEVYSNRIIKNYNSVQQDTFLSRLKLRPGDCLFAFQLYVDFKQFISNHYSSNHSIGPKDMKVDSFIDTRHQQKGWIFGKVCQIEYLPYTQQSLVKVLHKFSKDEQWEVKYDFMQNKVAKFPSRCFANAQQYHLQVLQRYFNEATNQMQICNMPLVLVLTSWMRWKEFKYLVYLQIKRFISQQYSFQDVDQDDQQALENMRLNSCKDIKSSKKIMNDIHVNKFKEYFNNVQTFPYEIHLTDAEGRCAICFKFLKSKIFKGENDSYCKGCQLSQNDPISWQIKVADIVICIDWKGTECFKTDIIQQHPSLINLVANRKQKVTSLTECITKRFQTKTQVDELLCCNQPQKVQIRSWLQNSPQIIQIYIPRIRQESDGYRTIDINYLSYPLKNLQISKSLYSLTGITSIQGTSKNMKYKTYLKKENLELVKSDEAIKEEWIQFDGEHTRVVSEKNAMNCCALVLVYRKDVK